MDINITLLVEMVFFIIFIAITMKCIWPKVIGALEARQKTIADGLAAAEKGQRDLELAQVRVDEIINDAKVKSATIVDHASQRAHQMMEEAKAKSRDQGEKMVDLARLQIDQERQALQDSVMKDISRLVVDCAEGVLKREINAKDSEVIIDQLLGEA